MAVEIHFNEAGINNCANELGSIQNQLSEIRNSLISLNRDLTRSWTDDAVVKFSGDFNRGIDYMMDMMLAIDSMEQFLNDAVSFYREVEQYISGL